MLVYLFHSGLKGTKDGQAFDTDGYCHNTLFQYNYSHDNDDGTFITKPGFGGTKNVLFEKNLLYGRFEGIPEEWRGMIVDPLLMAPGTGGMGLDQRCREAAWMLVALFCAGITIGHPQPRCREGG